MMLYMAGSSALRKSICMKVGASEGGVAIRLAGSGWLWKRTPRTETMRMASMTLPGTR